MVAAAISAAFSFFETPKMSWLGLYPSPASSDIPPPPMRAPPRLAADSLSIAPWTRGPRASAGRAIMSLSNTDHACPVCGRPMRLLTTIRRVPGEQTLVLQCGPCGLSTTEILLGWQGNLRCRRHPILVAPPPPTLSTHRVRHAGPFEQTSATAIDVEGVQYCTDSAQATA
jgi:hypothetical protein